LGFIKIPSHEVIENIGRERYQKEHSRQEKIPSGMLRIMR